MNPDGKGKLSKRTAAKYGIPIAPIGYTDDNGVYQMGWKDLGYEPHAFMNALALIGWNPGHDKEVMTMDDMISSFSLDRVHKAGARFDMAKATWINSQWIQSLVSDDYLTKDITNKLKNLTVDQRNALINETKKRCNFQKDFAPIVDNLFTRKDNINIDDSDMTILNGVIKSLDTVTDWRFDNISNAITDFITNSGLKSGKVLGLLRKTVVYNTQGIDVKNSMFILGKTEVLNRLKGYLVSNII
jgi:glutamyl-tRNA synthetase